MVEGLGTTNVLVMSRVEGQSLDTLEAAPQAERDRVAHLLFELLFNEIFAFRHVQTDPNLANYLYDPASRRLVLLDFGATRRFDAALVEAYRRLLGAGMAGDRAGLDAAASEIGYFGAQIEDRHRQQVQVNLIEKIKIKMRLRPKFRRKLSNKLRFDLKLMI